MDYKLRWSKDSIADLEDILSYLSKNWSERILNNFKKKLSLQLDLIAQNPLMFPQSTYNPELRKAVLSKQTSIFYKIKDNTIFIVHIFVNTQNIQRLK
ncbi:MAG: type II toxin-antitoxin system RelE/ParE family toxin [Bacteroidales bacterium]